MHACMVYEGTQEKEVTYMHTYIVHTYIRAYIRTIIKINLQVSDYFVKKHLIVRDDDCNSFEARGQITFQPNQSMQIQMVGWLYVCYVCIYICVTKCTHLYIFICVCKCMYSECMYVRLAPHRVTISAA